MCCKIALLAPVARNFNVFYKNFINASIYINFKWVWIYCHSFFEPTHASKASIVAIIAMTGARFQNYSTKLLIKFQFIYPKSLCGNRNYVAIFFWCFKLLSIYARFGIEIKNYIPNIVPSSTEGASDFDHFPVAAQKCYLFLSACSWNKHKEPLSMAIVEYYLNKAHAYGSEFWRSNPPLAHWFINATNSSYTIISIIKCRHCRNDIYVLKMNLYFEVNCAENVAVKIIEMVL